MTPHRAYGVATLFCGLGGKTRGVLQARGGRGSRFESVGAFDVDAEACADFETLTGSPAQLVDIASMDPASLARRCSRRPDLVVMSPPCKGWSGCLPEAASRSPRYQALNDLALYALDLALEAWAEPPSFILVENVPRMLTRGKKELERAKALLRARGYLVDLRTHNCGELGKLAQNRTRVLVVARLPGKMAASSLLMPPRQTPLAMSTVLWPLPVPTPGSGAGGPLHALPQLSALNFVRLAAIRAGRDWRDLPEGIRLPGDDDGRRHAGKYGVQQPGAPAHTVLSEARTGKGWADVADPRLAPRAARQNGGFGVGDDARAAHTVLGEGSVRNTFSSVSDPRLGCSPHSGTMGVSSPAKASATIVGAADIHNSPSAVCDPRVREQRRGAYEVLRPEGPALTVRGRHDPRVAPSSVADSRHFEPTHRLVVDQGLDASRDEWTAGGFELVGEPVDISRKGRPVHLLIEAPDGTIHRPMTTLELAVLQGLPAWHRPGDPEELALGEEGGQWLELAGGSSARHRQRIGNAVPPPTAKAFAEQVLLVLDAGTDAVFSLSQGGVWVQPERTTIKGAQEGQTS